MNDARKEADKLVRQITTARQRKEVARKTIEDRARLRQLIGDDPFDTEPSEPDEPQRSDEAGA